MIFKFRKKPEPVAFKDGCTLDIVVDMNDGTALDTIRIASKFDNPDAFIFALYKIGSTPGLLSELAAGVGAREPIKRHSDDGLGRGYL